MQILVSLLCMTIAYVDIRHRQIYLLQVFLLFGLSVLTRIVVGINDDFMPQIALNIAWLLLLFGVIYSYTKLVKRMDLHRVIGAGDWMMLAALCPLFEFKLFVAFLTSGFLFSLGAGLILMRVQKKDSIPLAGLLGIWVIPVLLFEEGFEQVIFKFYFSTI